MRPRHGVVLVVRAHHPGEQPGADDVVRVGAQVEREDPAEQVLVGLPAARDVRGQRRGRPGVHDVGVADEAAGLAALRLVVPARRRRGRVQRQVRLGRHQRVLVVGLAVGVEGVPDRERDAEEPLARDQPVAVQAADPVLVAVLHVRRHPLDLRAARDQLVAQLGVPAAVLDVPLARGDDLQRLVALLVEVRHPLGRLRLAVEVAGRAQRRDHRLAGAEGGLPRQLGVRRSRRLGGEPLGRLAVQPAVAADDRADRQLQLAPPGHVGQVAERAAHRDAGALVGLGEPVRVDRDLHAEHRRGHGLAEQRPGSARRRGARSARRPPGSARDGWSRCRPGRRGHRGTRPGGRRRRTPGPRARPARRRSGR